jgi:DNA helicase-2/ATP-dependent DNA helicase PcrA
MSTLDRLANFKSNLGSTQAKPKPAYAPVFDTKTTLGAYLTQVHKTGKLIYKLPFIRISEVSDLPRVMTEERYMSMSDEERANYKPDYDHIEYTELYYALTMDGNQIINAAAGAGKTTVLISKVQRDIVTGSCMRLQTLPNGMTVSVVDKVFVGTFLRSGAEELKQALLEWQRKLGYSETAGQVVFSTLDAEFKRCLESMGVAVKIGEQSTLDGCFRRAVKKAHIVRDDGKKLTAEDYRIIGSVVTYARGRLDDKKYSHPSALDYCLNQQVTDMLIRLYASERMAYGVMDFEDISELLYRYLYVTTNPAVQDVVASRYNYMYLDEFQDTSQIQYAILRAYRRGNLAENTDSAFDANSRDALYTGVPTLGKIVVVGDQSQTIYSFRGSDSKVLTENFPKDFNPSITPLSVNWRCPKTILSPIIPSIHLNKDSENQAIKSARVGGELHAYEFISVSNMADHLIKSIDEDIQANRSVAILCRTNFEGLIPALCIEKAKLGRFSISSEGMTLSSALPRSILNIANLFMQLSDTKVRSALNILVPYYVKYEVNDLVNALENSKTKTNAMTIWTMPLEDIEYSCPSLLDLIKGVRSEMFDEQGNRVQFADIRGLRYLYSYMYTETFAKNTTYNENAKTLISALLNLIERNNYATIREFVDDIVRINDRLKTAIKLKNASIVIATVHEYKGKEADSVYVWNDSDGVFPSSKTDLSDADLVAEERRVHYIACTRAKEREHIYTLVGKHGMFIDEMDIRVENPNQGQTMILGKCV